MPETKTTTADTKTNDETTPLAYEITNREEFIRGVRDGTITLPYKRSYTSDSAIRGKFEKLRLFTDEEFRSREVTNVQYTIANADFTPAELVFRDSADSPAHQLLLVNKSTDYTNTGAISDMFQEHNRLKARYTGAKYSPHDFFYKCPELIADDCMRTAAYGGKITPYNAREALYWQSNECSAFNPVVMLYLINKFSVKSVLDPCAGWGDRLVAAIATGIRYVGVDPNTDLFAGYEAIKKFFIGDQPDACAKITLINQKIQSASLPKVANGRNETFDMVFTSPPYFNLEEYTGNGRVTETSEAQWMWNFMWPMIDIAIRRLNPGGYLAINLNQQAGQTYLRSLVAGLLEKPMMEYLGVISYTDARFTNPQPIWIWRSREQNQKICAENRAESCADSKTTF